MRIEFSCARNGQNWDEFRFTFQVDELDDALDFLLMGIVEQK